MSQLMAIAQVTRGKKMRAQISGLEFPDVYISVVTYESHIVSFQFISFKCV